MTHFYMLLSPKTASWQLIDVSEVERQEVWSQLSGTGATKTNAMAGCAAAIASFFHSNNEAQILSFESELPMAELETLLKNDTDRMLALIKSNSIEVGATVQDTRS